MRRRSFIWTALASAAIFHPAKAATPRRSKTVEVINSGVSGNNTFEVLARLDKDCLDHKPTLTIFMIGTNDMNSKKFVPLEVYKKNLTQIVEAILNTGSKIVLMNLLPVYEPYLFTRHQPDFYNPEGHSGRLKQMNELIATTAEKYQLSTVDLHHVFSKVGNIGLDRSSLIRNEANSNTTDGLHPTAEGYRLIGTTVYQHVVCNGLNTGKVVCLGDSITFGDGKQDGDNYPAWLKKLLTH